MRDPNEFQEIEEYGEQAEPEAEEGQRVKKSGGSLVPLLQALLCALALLALVILKITDFQKYEQVADWYQSEASRGIELPSWVNREEKAPASLPESSRQPEAVLQGGDSLQRV